MRFLTLGEVLELHRRILAATGGAPGLRDLGSLESAIAQPRMTAGGEDLYNSLEAKAAALGYFLVRNHPFIDGNKRVGHAAMETFLVLNGLEIDSTIDEQERTILKVATGQMTRDELTHWIESRVRPRPVEAE